MLLLLQLRLMNGVRLLAQMVQDWNMDLKDHRSNPTGDAIAVAAALLLFPLLMLTDEREIGTTDSRIIWYRSVIYDKKMFNILLDTYS